MSRKKRKNRQIAKAKEALVKAGLEEFKRIEEMTQEEMLQQKYELDSNQATNSLGDFFTDKQLKQIP